MVISAENIKKLREITNAGILDCKKALEATDGDIDKAITWLREKGIAKAAKKTDRIAAEGLVGIAKKDNCAVVFEVNSETDFVAQNDKFLALIDKIGALLVNNQPKTMEKALAIVDSNGETLEAIINNAIATIGEKISLRRFEILIANEQQTLGTYVHANKRIAVGLLFSNTISPELAKQLAMHVAAMKPKFISRDEMSSDFLNHEKAILLAEAQNDSKNANKPSNIIEKMVEGRLTKQLAEISLLEQQFVINPDQKIKDILLPLQAKILTMIRYEVGEGIEKESIDFASEVMAQINKK